jgi:uncharacterized protein with NAD-binding domain and iron-sulfur cluster
VEQPRRRIAILGGGMASLAAAWELTNDPDRRRALDITVYQLGWRLGGKGASGRNPSMGLRIEEHGLHVWFGCYDNAFRLLRHCYEELGRPAGAPMATIEQAFTPADATPYFENVDGTWKLWPIWFPPNPEKPGVSTHLLPSPWDYVVMLAEFIAHEVAARRNAEDPGPHLLPGWLRPHVPDLLGGVTDSVAHMLLRLVKSLAPDPATHEEHHHRGILWLLDRLKAWLATHFAGALEHHDDLRRFVITADLGLTAIRGLIADGVITRGFAVIDGEDARAWFARHGALDMTVHSTPMRALYDLYFAYEDGTIAKPSLSAAAALHAVLRIACTYKGSVLYEMQAGMGDVVIAPVYEVLRRRGVRFEFFHRVRRLELTADGTALARVHLARQVDLKTGGYEPLVDVGGLPCWPSEPLYDQIVDGDRLRGVTLESRWSGWRDAGEVALEQGRDFDTVILGISLAGLREVCAELVDRHPRWRDLVDHVRTCQTQALQLWLDRSLEDLGWSRGAVPVDAAPEPLDVWADRTALLDTERWGPGGPRSLQYLCGPLPGDYAARPPEDRQVPEEASAQALGAMERWLTTLAPALWPKAVGADGGFDWSVLADPQDRQGRARMQAQYWRANVDPSERYVLSVPGTGRYRLANGDTDVRNLVVAGDWTRTDWNIGCIEAAVLSGLGAAKAAEET